MWAQSGISWRMFWVVSSMALFYRLGWPVRVLGLGFAAT